MGGPGRPRQFSDAERLERKRKCAIKWRNKNITREREKARLKQAAYRAKHPKRVAELRRAAHFRQAYGLTIKQLDEMLLAQGGRCAICRTDKEPKRSPRLTSGWAVDHIHGTKKVRGILCYHCNTALGLMKDDPARCIAAAVYLNTHQK